MMKYLQSLCFLAVGMISNAALSAQSGFIEGSVGAAFHEIELGNGSTVSSIGEYLSISRGIEMQHTLSVMGTVRLWNTEEQNDQGTLDHVLFHDFHFAGLSFGVDAQLFLPSLAQGPYLKAGRHCWTANVSEVFNIWNGSGCSNLVGAGVLWGLNSGQKGSVFSEVLLTRFKYVNSWMLAFGVRF